MYKNNYAESGSLPDWIIDASKAKAVTGADKDRAARYLKEHRHTLSSDEGKTLKEIIVNKRETDADDGERPKAIPEFYYDSNKTSF
jgi:hypothetical protein